MKLIIERIKKSWLSLTMWFNGLMLMVVTYLPEITASVPEFKGLVGDGVYKWLLLLSAIGNIILRVKTTQDLASKGK